MKIAIAGGSGFIGKTVSSKLIELNHDVYILTRNPNNKQKKGVQFVQWLSKGSTPEKELEGIDAFINLAGENLNSGRWTKAKKEEILQSRISATNEVVRIIKALKKKPEVLVNGSAVGFYGTSIQNTFTEADSHPGSDFLATVVREWENTASKASDDVRVVFSRFGMVIDKDEGALKKMLLPFKLFIGGNLGSGQQWMSWVHIEDVANTLIFCIENKQLEGPVNVTAPNPVRMKEFGKTVAAELGRPYWAPVPGFFLRVALGEMSVLVVEGQRVLPKKLEEANFQFQFPELTPAIKDLLS
ncbi:TIGR01777 family oxidoreductase [Evansella sp. AB-rgal1]|uniref:TIGR01777 family oxidoreductase n=1 Tax=Evansella sp. AB-rgal1 TaxID=3242696 RepID=UPI00359EAADA